MAQAERISTAIREPMSRGRPVNSTNLWWAVQTEFLAALAGIGLAQQRVRLSQART
jgi:hypothetical protein